MTSATRLVFFQDSVLKQEPVPVNQLPSYKRQNIPAGTILVLQSYTVNITQDHHRITLKNLQFDSFSSWYVFARHVDIIFDRITPIESIDTLANEQQNNKEVKIFVERGSLGTQQGFLKLVVNVDTVLKREPVDSAVLKDEFKQSIPAGTELILSTSQPDVNNTVKFPLVSNHVRFSLKDLDFKGFSSNWYAFDKHVGIDRVG